MGDAGRMSSPRRTEGVVTRSLGDELVAYDPVSFRTHALNAAAAAVFAACDGTRTIGELSTVFGADGRPLDAEAVTLALCDLADEGLIELDVEDGFDRRTLMRRVGMG